MEPFPGETVAAAPGIHPAGAPAVPPSPTAWERARPIVVPVVVALLAKVAMLLLAYVMMQQPDQFAHRLATRWDGEHYLRIAHDGYEYRGDGSGDSVAFAFLYPATIALFGGSETAALAVANVCSLAAVAVVAWQWGPRAALALALFPSWLVFGTVAYSEGLYVLLAAGAFALLERGARVASGGLAALGACTRFMAGPALLLGTVPWERGQWREPRRWLPFAFVSLAGIVIFAFQWAYTGHVFGYLEAQKAWSARIAWPWEHFDWLLHGWFTLQGGPIREWGNLSPIDFVTRDLLFLTPVVAGIVLLWRTPGRRGWAVYSTVALAIALCTIGTPAVSLPRFLVSCFPALLAVGDRMRSPLLWSATVVGAVALAAHGLVHHLFGYWS